MKKILSVLLLFCIATAFSSLESIPELIEKWNAYYAKYPQVRLQLIFNQEKYAPGDTAFFKAYFLTEDYKLIAQKQILTLQMKDHEGNNVMVQNFRVSDGQGNNQLIFSDKMAVGEYTIVAYSEWMKNFDPQLFFQKPLVLAGRKEVIKMTKTDSLAIYVEGGTLVEGVENKLILHSFHSGPGKILNQQGSLVAEFEIPKSGIDEVLLTPEKGATYYAELNGVNSKFPLMGAVAEGCALQVKDAGVNQVELTVLTSGGSSLRKQELSLLVAANGKIIYSTPFQIAEGHSLLAVKNLAPGLNQFYIFDKKNKVLASRIYYVTPTPLTPSIQITEDDIKPRGPVDFEVSLSDENGRPLNGTFTTTAVNTSLFPQTLEISWASELLLFNDLPDLRKNFQATGMEEQEWIKNVNNQLITQTWTRTVWNEILNGRKNKTDYDFKYSLNLKGEAKFKASGDPVPDSTQVMIYLQKTMVGYEAYTNKEGEFAFPFIYDFPGNDKAFYMMTFNKRVKQEDYWVKPELIINTSNAVESEVSENTDAYGEYMFRKRLIDKSFSFFIEPEKAIEAKAINLNSEFEDELGGSDVSIKVDDYVVFPTMADLIHEVIGGLQVRQFDKKAGVRVVFLRNTYTVIPKGDPLFIIDGVLTKNTDFFLGLNPQDVLTIKLINAERKLQRLGEMGKNGIVLVQTKKLIADEVLANSTVFPLSGLTEEIEFKNPVYSTSSARVPDLRSTLYWNPKVTLGSSGKANLKFYASDDAGPVTLKISGLTTDGRPFSVKKTILVKAPAIKNP